MRKRYVMFTRFLGVLPLLALAGCLHVPAGRVTMDRMDYGQVIAESWKRQTLLNVVRLRYADAPVFLDVSSVINTYSLSGSVSAGGSVSNSPTFGDSISMGAGGAWSNTPTVTYQPLMGDRFTKSLLQPIPPAAVMQLVQGGWPADLVLKTVVRSINGLRNDSLGVAGDPGFREIVGLLSRLQHVGGLGNRIEARKDGSAVILVLRPESKSSGPVEDTRRVAELLGLEEGASEIEVVYGFAPRSGREVSMITRSMLEIIMNLGVGIDLPAGDATSGRVLPGLRQPGEEAAAPLVHIRSGAAAPEATYAAVPYRLLSWRHSGFNVHSRVRAKTREEAERVGKYMIRPLLSLERLSLDEREGQLCYRYGKEPREVERLDYLEFIARVTSHIPNKGQVTVRYYGLYANAHRGKIKKASLKAFPLRMVEEELRPIPSKGWAEMIHKVYEVDPMVCPKCGATMKVISFLTDYPVVDKIIGHLKLTFVAERPPPPHTAYQEVLMAAEVSTEYSS